MLTKVRGLKAEALKRYNLTDEDLYTIIDDESGDKVILKRQGIDKVEKKLGMLFRIDSIQTVPYGNKCCTTIVGTGRVGDFTATRTASANPDNCKNSNHFAEMAEKRAKHRILLSLADLYEHGIYSCEESDDWSESRNKWETAVKNVEKSLDNSPQGGASVKSSFRKK